jgi:hypothetical protein
MKILLAILLISGAVFAQSYSCLPKDGRIKETDLVSKNKTVKQTLRVMKAKCWKGKLVDAKKREIYFYDLQGCWGNPPQDYLEIMDNQRKEIAELKKKYTVIEINCNPDGRLIQ